MTGRGLFSLRPYPGKGRHHAVAEDPPDISGPLHDSPEGRPPVDLDDDHRIAAARRLRGALGDNATLQTLSVLASQLLQTEFAKISLVTEVHQMVAATWMTPGTIEQHHPRDESLSAVTAASGRPLVLADTSLDARVRDLPLVVDGSAASFLGVPLFDKHGELVGALCAYDRSVRTWRDLDVTVMEELAEAVVAELERIALGQEHETVRLRLDLAMEAAGVGSWDWDVGTDTLAWDDRMFRIFGFEPGSFAGTLDAFRQRVHPDDAAGVERALAATVEQGVEYDETYRIVMPDASVRWISARGRALSDQDGRVVRVIGAASDVTERHLAGQRTASILALLELVAEASRVLHDSLEVEDAVRGLARLVVPALADWSLVTLVGEDGVLRDVESWAQDPALRPAAAQLARHRLDGLTDPGALGEALRSGEPVFVESGGAARAESILASPEAREAVRRLGYESSAVLPLVVGEEIVGLLSLARGPQRNPISGPETAAALEIARRAGRALEHARSFDRVRDMSEQLQRSLLTEPAQSPGLETAVHYTPAALAAQVGGDWYDAFLLPDGSTTLVVGDVIGHDSASAAAMGHLRSLTRGIAYSGGAAPAGVLTQVASAMQGLQVDTIATVVLARLRQDPATGTTRMTWASAGHPPLLVCTPGGEPTLLEGEDLLLGLASDEPRHEAELVLEPGSVVLMFTDGLVERRGEHLSVGLERLREVVGTHRDLPPGALLAEVQRALLPVAPDDDVAMLAVRVSAPASS